MRAYKKPVGSATRLVRCLRHLRVPASPASRIDGLTRTQAAEPTGPMVNIELSSDGSLHPAGFNCANARLIPAGLICASQCHKVNFTQNRASTMPQELRGRGGSMVDTSGFACLLRSRST